MWKKSKKLVRVQVKFDEVLCGRVRIDQVGLGRVRLGQVG